MKPHHNKLLWIDAKIYIVMLAFCLAVFIALGIWWIAPFIALFLTVCIHLLNYDIVKLLTGGKK